MADEKSDDSWNEGWFDGPGTSYLANLQGVTIPSTTPPIDQSPRHGRHSSPENTLNTDAPSMQHIVESLNNDAAAGGLA